MADRFYVNSPLAAGAIELHGEEAHHLAIVCRLRPGEEVALFNGDGAEYRARILEAHKRVVHLEVLAIDHPNRELPFEIRVAAPLPKGDRTQFLIEKLTELGVTSFIPLQTARSVITPREARLEKLQRYVIEASKQCGRNNLMTIEPLCTWETLVGESSSLRRIVAHPQGGGLAPGRTGDAPGWCVAVGPEGGFTDTEIEQAQRAGWETVDLGARIMRMETAALVLAAALAIPWRKSERAE